MELIFQKKKWQDANKLFVRANSFVFYSRRAEKMAGTQQLFSAPG
jgi:hypothetical protein